MADGASPDRAFPAALGFRMPAEWEPHHATWIGWPHNASDWPGKIAPIPWVYGEIVRKLAPGEIVRILVNSAAHERRALRVNGRGTLLTTEECLLDREVQVRNPGLSRAELEQVLRQLLGVTNVLWLGKGIAGDDTHGHVDDLCRFVDARTVVLCSETDAHDANYRALRENRERLEGMRLEDGSKIEVVALPMPAPRYCDGQRLPASYANFYIANGAVLVPTFNDANDRVALGLLAELMDRPVVGIHAVDLVWGLGTLHCLTQQEPAAGGEQ